MTNGEHERLIREEQQKMYKLRRLVDTTAVFLGSGALTFAESIAMIEWAKQQVLQLFPGTEEQFEQIYHRRFARIIYDRFREIFLN